jgi:hypothetical protein
MVQIWQDDRKRHTFRVQTKDRNLHQHMQLDSRFQLIGEGHNVDVWIYHASFPSMQAAYSEIEALENKTMQR